MQFLEVEAVRKGDGADRQRAKVIGSLTTKCKVPARQKSFFTIHTHTVFTLYIICTLYIIASDECIKANKRATFEILQ